MKKNIAWVLCFVLLIGLLVTPAMAAYKVTFDLGGGEFTEKPADYKVDNDTIYVVSEDTAAYFVTKDVKAPTRSGYTFKGWKLGDYVIEDDTYQITGDVTLTAIWESNGSSDTPGGSGSSSAAKTPVVKTRTPGPTSFLDVHISDWFYNDVMWASAQGLMVGYGNGYFGPNDPVTRAVLIQVLYNMSDDVVEEITDKYTDVKATDWYAAAATWALQNGFGGRSATVFGADDVLTREQTMVILYAYAKGTPATADLSVFEDADSISAGALEAVTWAVSKDIMRGMANGKLEPLATTTRAQLAALLHRIDTKA